MSHNYSATNLAIYGELGRYPLYINTIISMIKYWVRLCKNTHHDPLLREAYEENLLMYGRLYKLLIKCESLLLLTPTFLLLLNKPTISEAYKSTGLTVWSNICIQFGAEQDHMLTHPENVKSRHIYSIKKKLQNNYETFWKINLNKCEKLNRT
jgi:hypothetical protein